MQPPVLCTASDLPAVSFRCAWKGSSSHEKTWLEYLVSTASYFLDVISMAITSAVIERVQRAGRLPARKQGCVCSFLLFVCMRVCLLVPVVVAAFPGLFGMPDQFWFEARHVLFPSDDHEAIRLQIL